MAVDILHTRNLFLRCMCVVYMFAFGSLYIQIPGLYGENGILPAHVQLENLSQPKKCFYDQWTLLCFTGYVGLSVANTMELMALCCTVLSFIGLVWSSWCTTIFYFVLWFSYLSVYKVGQTFLWFQCILVAPLSHLSRVEFRPRNLVTMWLVRWALFRLMFASGVVKLQSSCPTWWTLSALDVHFESQCIPTPLAWFFHHFPPWINKLNVVAAMIVEIAIPFLFFSPVRGHRLFAFYTQALLQILIIVTGNYNFFNLLTLAMCVSLLDDVHLGYQYVRDLSFGFIAYVKSSCSWLIKWLVYGGLVYFSMAFFSLRITPQLTIDSEITFSKQNFSDWLSHAVPLSIAIGAFSLVMTIAEALTSALFEIRGCLAKFGTFAVTVLYSAAALAVFGISLVPYATLDQGTSQRLWPPLRVMQERTSDFHLASSYGLFRSMTGVGGRPEVILEGSDLITGPWVEYEFPYKPGSLARAPPFVAPHQPRVDWQLWFAALGSYNNNPWLISLAHRLLSGVPQVVALLDGTSPWRDVPPKYIRASKFLYHYTNISEWDSGDWWKREHIGEYMPIFAVDHAPLLEYLRKSRLVGSKDMLDTNWAFVLGLKWFREAVDWADPALALWALFATAGLLMLTRLSRQRADDDDY